MRWTGFYLAFGAFLLTAGVSPAYAITITCDGVTPGQLQSVLIDAAGGVIQITGICVGDIVAPFPITLTNHNNSSSLSATDGIKGKVQVGTEQTTINGLTLENSGSVGVNVLGLSWVTMMYSRVTGAQQDGIVIGNGGFVMLENVEIDHNGLANQAGQNNGINVNNGILNITDGFGNSLIENNAGYGIYDLNGDAASNGVAIHAVTLQNDTLGEIYVFGTNLRMKTSSPDTTITASGTAPPIQALGASAVLIDGVTVSGSSGAVLVANASGLTLANSTISTTSTTVPAIEASGASSVVITGGDTITAASGTAIEIDHSSSLMHRPLSTVIPGATNAVESITGAGLVQVQSSMDLGQGLVSSTPSISWTTGANGISVQQNSSFRVSGGVSITGAVAITQGSNGFANTANGGTNAITSASCPFTSVPSSHWAAPTKVTPAVPSASSYSSATSPQCLAF